MVTVPSFDRVNWSSETERKPETQSSTMGNYYEETRALAEQAAKNMVSITGIEIHNELSLTYYRPSTSP
jgi:hypothetical protein